MVDETAAVQIDSEGETIEFQVDESGHVVSSGQHGQPITTIIQVGSGGGAATAYLAATHRKLSNVFYRKIP